MQHESAWRAPPEAFYLPAHEVHVWRASLMCTPMQVEQLTRVLADDERARAARFRFAHDARRFIVSRALLRVLLGRYTHVAPEKLQFCYSPYGKPALVAADGPPVPSFNLSHAHEMALYAFAAQQEPGIDVEYLRRPIPDAVQLAKRYFSAQEHQLLASLAPAEVPAHFFRMWVRTEARLKAWGIGLSGLDVGTDVLPSNAPTMSIYDILPATDYVAALALPQPVQQILCWDADTFVGV